MPLPAPAFRRFAGSLLLSGALHAALLAALAWNALSVGRLGGWHLYEVDIEPEPPRSAAPAALAPPPSPDVAPGGGREGEAEPEGDPAGVVGGVPGGVRVPFPVGPGARVGDHPAPAAAQAGRVLAAEGEGGAADFTVVQGSGAHYAGGVSAATGTSTTAVNDPRAQGAGVVPRNAAPLGVRAPAPKPALEPRPPPAAPGPSQAVAARPVSKSWSCAFPPEANVNGVNYARVLLAVTVRADGRAASVSVLSDPGNGFGRAAQSCAFAQRYVVARDAGGRAITATTVPFHVTFTR